MVILFKPNDLSPCETNTFEYNVTLHSSSFFQSQSHLLLIASSRANLFPDHFFRPAGSAHSTLPSYSSVADPSAVSSRHSPIHYAHTPSHLLLELHGLLVNQPSQPEVGPLVRRIVLERKQHPIRRNNLLFWLPHGLQEGCCQRLLHRHTLVRVYPSHHNALPTEHQHASQQRQRVLRHVGQQLVKVHRLDILHVQ